MGKKKTNKQTKQKRNGKKERKKEGKKRKVLSRSRPGTFSLTRLYLTTTPLKLIT